MRGKKFDNIVSKVLVSYFERYEKSELDNFIIYSDSYDEYSEALIEYDYDDGRLFIDDSITNLFSGMFAITPSQAQTYVCKWFMDDNYEKKDLKVEFLDTPKIGRVYL